MRSRPGIALVLALVAAILGGERAQAAEDGRVAVGADGTAHFSWMRNDATRTLVHGRSRAPDGTLLEGQYVSPATRDTANSLVVAGPGDDALHAWLIYESGGAVVKLRRRSPDGSAGPVQTLSEPGVLGAFEVAADGEGNAWFVWLRMTGGRAVVESRRRAANGTLGTVKRLSAAAPTYDAREPDVAVDAAGNALFAWTVSAFPSYVQVRSRAADGTLGTTQNLTSGSTAGSPDVGVDGAGNAVVAFHRVKDGGTFVQVRRRSATGGLGATQDLSAPAPIPLTPQVAVSPAAGAIVAWRMPNGGQSYVQATWRPAGGTWGLVTAISPTNANATTFKVAVDADGDAQFAWRRADASASYLQLRRRTAAGALGVAQTITPLDGTALDPDLAVEPDGGAFVTWTSGDQVHFRRRSADGALGTAAQLSY